MARSTIVFSLDAERLEKRTTSAEQPARARLARDRALAVSLADE